ncbi:putative fatty-acid amide hydrolase [Rhexocercosporidium sp. MPI-PUGE-AT-0058]|nr:putative fatty-acid amide hydrolase [Rhexocercosporidium sp. MPI-PUGE-AT-0058]
MLSDINDYKSIAANKKARQWDRIPKSWRISAELYQDTKNVIDIPLKCGILNEMESKITSHYDATALLEQLKAGVWSAEEVTVAFCKRAAIAQQLTNCLTEIFFDEAIERAKKLDLEYRASIEHGHTLPPLFGLPISLKDSFQVQGHDTSTGLGCYTKSPAESNSALATMLLSLGAILYCKTNLPQSIMTGDSHNNIFGRTLNPRNKLLTAGGSTGGEGALIALRGSILGVGTDIGGSIRVPAVCNGIYGFRPSVGMLPHGGVRDLNPAGLDGVRSTVGPMATSIRDCELFLKTLLQANTWKYDSAVVSIPWVGLKPRQKLRIGVAFDDGVYTPSPPLRRGLKQSVDLLHGRDDVEIVNIHLPDVKLHYQSLLGFLTLSGSDHYLEQFARTNEPIIPSLKASGLLSAPGTTLQGFFNLNVRRAEAGTQYLELFRSNDLDAILMPPAPHTAVTLDRWASVTYTGLWNYLDYPAVVIPVDEVRHVDFVDDMSNARFGVDDEKLYGLYTGPEQYKGAPVCVQVVGYRHRDEAFIKVAGVLDSIINKN